MAEFNPPAAASRPAFDRFGRDQIAGYVNLLTYLCHAEAEKWYRDPKTGEYVTRNDGECIALIHSEASEALEHLRKGTMDDKLPHRKGVEVELADLVIRVCDMAAALDLDLGGALVEKLLFNRQRADHKPENRALPGGKAF